MLLDAVVLRFHPYCEPFIAHFTDTFHPRVLCLHRERKENRIFLTSEGGPCLGKGEKGALIQDEDWPKPMIEGFISRLHDVVQEGGWVG